MEQLELPEVGTKAPTFSLLNQDEQTISLSESLKKFKKVVLYFYPKALTSGCTVQACGVRDSLEEFKKKKVLVLGISGDEPKKLIKFREKENLNFDLLSDPDFSVAKAYGVWGTKKLYGREYKGIYRITFIIDKEGKIESIMKKVNTKTHHLDLLKLI